MTIVSHEAQLIKDCPQCRMGYLPEKMGNQWFVTCRKHGHMAIGNDYPTAVRHWNIYIGSIIQESAADMTEDTRTEFSYCVFCRRQTGSIPYISLHGYYETECANCHLSKYAKPDKG